MALQSGRDRLHRESAATARRLLGKKNTEVVPHSVDELKQILIHDLVREIAAKVGNITVSVEGASCGRGMNI